MLILSLLFLGFLFLQASLLSAIYYALRKIRKRDNNLLKDGLPPLSVLVAAHNEEEHLLEHIPHLLGQDYPDFELVLINDRSTDGTLHVMQAYAQRNPKIRIVNIKELHRPSTSFGKKNALSFGIKAASHDHLVFTDADCRPGDTQWLKRFGSNFARGHNFVIGTGFFQKQPTFLNALYRLESVRVAMLYFSAAAAGLPYMAVGRSMGYTRDLFFEARGFTKHAHIPSGDDDLFFQSVSKKASVALAPDALTISTAPHDISTWIRQKARHVSAGVKYPFGILFLLGLYEVSLMASVAGMFVFWSISSSESMTWAFYILLAFRYILVYIDLKTMQRIAGVKDDAAKLFLADVILSIGNTLISVADQLSKSARWMKRT